MAMQQAAMNARVGTPCEFVLLNPPAQRGFGDFQEGVDFAVVDPARGDTQGQLDELERLLEYVRIGPRFLPTRWAARATMLPSASWSSLWSSAGP